MAPHHIMMGDVEQRVSARWMTAVASRGKDFPPFVFGLCPWVIVHSCLAPLAILYGGVEDWAPTAHRTLTIIPETRLGRGPMTEEDTGGQKNER